jgi:hypothetical protein
MKNSQLERLKEYHQIIVSENNKLRAEAKLKEFNRLKRIQGSLDFRISYTKRGKTGLEEFYVEGHKNALNIFDLYKNSGFDLGIKKLTLWVNEDEKVKALNFKYHIDRK